MEPAAGKPSFMRNIIVRVLFFGVLVIGLRFAYVVTIRGESCDLGDFCFFSLPENFKLPGAGKIGPSAIVVKDAVRSTSSAPSRVDLWTSKDWRKSVQFYSSVFQDLMVDGYLMANSKSLCVETPSGQDVFALREIGVVDAIGTAKKKSPPLVVSALPSRLPFKDETFDFIFSGGGAFDKVTRPLDFASELSRTLKPEGFLVVHSKTKDEYSFNSFVDLFNCCQIVKTRELDGMGPSMPYIREIVLKKEPGMLPLGTSKSLSQSVDKCSVPAHKKQLFRKAESLITEEPLKPWITLKRNIKNIKYLSAMADISFKQRYVYIDVGARSYGSSIGSWFRKQYPKQNKTFEIYAIEADKTFHDEYKMKKGVTLLPYAAWVKNETLSFEINQDPGHKDVEKGRGMGRIQPGQSLARSGAIVDEIQGFDFADWLKKSVTRRDYVVMKMDVEGTEFDLIPRLFETGAICLIDEIFLECHYNRWQRCCPGERSSKYQKTYDQCMDLFSNLRKSGVLVHQWW